MNEQTCGTCRWWEQDGVFNESTGECQYAVRPFLTQVGPPGPWMWAYAEGVDCAELDYGLLTSVDFSCARWEAKP